MADYSELKRLAEAATPGPWAHECGDLFFKDPDGYTMHLMETCEGQDIALGHDSNLKFIAAANPATALALIAEVEQDAVTMRIFGDIMKAQAEEIDQLKSELHCVSMESESLRKDAGRYRWLQRQVENCEWMAGRSTITDKFGSVSEERVSGSDDMDQTIDAAMNREFDQ